VKRVPGCVAEELGAQDLERVRHRPVDLEAVEKQMS
jgi:hypothetical protein